MQTTRLKRCHGPKLYDEIVAAYPALNAVGWGAPQLLAVETTETQTSVRWPNDLGISRAQIDAIITSHDPTPPVVVDPIDAHLAMIDSATLAQARAAIKFVLRRMKGVA